MKTTLATLTATLIALLPAAVLADEPQTSAKFKNVATCYFVLAEILPIPEDRGRTPRDTDWAGATTPEGLNESVEGRKERICEDPGIDAVQFCFTTPEERRQGWSNFQQLMKGRCHATSTQDWIGFELKKGKYPGATWADDDKRNPWPAEGAPSLKRPNGRMRYAFYERRVGENAKRALAQGAAAPSTSAVVKTTLQDFEINGIHLGVNLAQVQAGYPSAQDKWDCKPANAVHKVECWLYTKTAGPGTAQVAGIRVDDYLASFLDGELFAVQIFFPAIGDPRSPATGNSDFKKFVSARLGPPVASYDRYSDYRWEDGARKLAFTHRNSGGYGEISLTNTEKQKEWFARVDKIVAKQKEQEAHETLQNLNNQMSNKDMQDQIARRRCEKLAPGLAAQMQSSNPTARELAFRRAKELGCI